MGCEIYLYAYMYVETILNVYKWATIPNKKVSYRQENSVNASS